MGNSGFIKLYRKMREWGWYSDPPTKIVFLHLLILAQYEENFYRGVHLKVGEVVATYPDIAEECGLSVQNVRTAIEHLKSTGELTVKRYPKFSVYTVENYSQYQDTNSLSNSQLTVNQQSTNSHPDIKEIKKSRNKEIIPPTAKPTKHKHGEYGHVLLTDEEYTKLQARYSDAEAKIQMLDTGIELKGYKYRNHYLAVINWAEGDKKKSCVSEKERFLNG